MRSPRCQGVSLVSPFSRLACLGRGGGRLPCRTLSPDAVLDGVVFCGARRGTRAPPPPDRLAVFYKLVDKKVIADVLCRHARAVELAATGGS